MGTMRCRNIFESYDAFNVFPRKNTGTFPLNRHPDVGHVSGFRLEGVSLHGGQSWIR